MKPIPWNAKLWKESVKRFHEFMAPLIAGLGRSERRVAAARFVEGLLMPGHRKSIGPMAERLGDGRSRTLSLLSGLPAPVADQSSVPETEPLPLAHRTILPALQG